MNFQIDLTQIILAVIGLIGAVVSGFLIPWLRNNTSAKVYAIIEAACDSAVMFAQQWYKQEDGERKKEEALKHAEAYLKERHISVDMNLLSECIEAELKKIKSEYENFNK